MDDLPRFTDFRAIADEIREQPEYAGVGKVIDRVALAQSCTSDLSEAQSCIDALNAVRSDPAMMAGLLRQTIESSLLRIGLLLYQRASTGGKLADDRGSIDIRAKLTTAQQEDHDAIVSVRHRTLAHVTTDEIDGERWHRELLFGIEQGVAWKPAGAAHRIQWSLKAFERLQRQLPVAMEVMMAEFDKALGRLTTALNSHPLPVEVYDRHVIDPVATFGSKENARLIVKSQAYRRAIIYG